MSNTLDFKLNVNPIELTYNANHLSFGCLSDIALEYSWRGLFAELFGRGDVALYRPSLVMVIVECVTTRSVILSSIASFGYLRP